MPQLPPVTDAYIDEIIKSTDVYKPELNKTQGVKMRELIKKLRDRFEDLFNGNVVVTGSVSASNGFFDTSDARLKTPATDAFDVSGLEAFAYTWKDGRDEKIHIGYAAQEVEKYLPDAVHTDAEGMKSVRYTEVLVAKIQMLEDKIAQLEKKFD